MISDVVTGQMDVRSVVIPDYIAKADEEMDETLGDAGEESEV